MINQPMKDWVTAASSDQQAELVRRVNDATGMHMQRQYLYHLANGLRKAGSGLASAIERVTVDMAARGDDLPVVYRSDLATACAECEYAKQCLKRN